MKKRELIKEIFRKTKLMLLGIVLFLFILNVHDMKMMDFLSNSFAEGTFYNYDEISYKNDKYVLNVTDFCSPFQGETLVDCVVEQVGGIYNYSERGPLPFTKRPLNFSKSGGLCRDIAVTYGAIFNNFDWHTEYRFDKPNHVFNVVSKDNIICFIDGEYYSCI